MKQMCKDSQVEFLVPLRIQLFWNGLGPLLRLAHLDSCVRIGRACLILGYQSLGAYHCGGEDDTVYISERRENISIIWVLLKGYGFLLSFKTAFVNLQKDCF